MKTYYSVLPPTPCGLGDVCNNGGKWYVWDVIDQKKETVITEDEAYTIFKPIYGWYEITEEEAKKLIKEMKIIFQDDDGEIQ